MINTAALTPIVDQALANAGVPEVERPKWYDHIFAAVCIQLITLVPEAKVTPKNIIAAANDLHDGLKQVAAGLEKASRAYDLLDYARSTVRLGDQSRAEALDELISAAVRAVFDRITYMALPGMKDTDRLLAIEAALPAYAPASSNVITLTQRGFAKAFEDAAIDVGNLVEQFPTQRFQTAPRSQDMQFVRTIGELGKVYSWATGKPFSPHNRPEGASADYTPPSCRFVQDVWPAMGPWSGNPPTIDMIKRAWETHVDLANEDES